MTSDFQTAVPKTPPPSALPSAATTGRPMLEIEEWRWPDRGDELPIGGTIPLGGVSERYETGSWRTTKPVLDLDICSHCLLCWVFCPDSAIHVADGKVTEIAYEYCKGCGICAHECPKEGAMTMAPDRTEATR